MKKLVIVLVCIGLALLFIKYVGGWQYLMMVLAGLAAPFKLMGGFFENEKDIRTRFENERRREKKYKDDLEHSITQNTSEAEHLRKTIQQSEQRLKELEAERISSHKNIDQMSSNELVELGRNYFGE